MNFPVKTETPWSFHVWRCRCSPSLQIRTSIPSAFPWNLRGSSTGHLNHEQMGVSINGGTPIAGWSRTTKIICEWMLWGGTSFQETRNELCSKACWLIVLSVDSNYTILLRDSHGPIWEVFTSYGMQLIPYGVWAGDFCNRIDDFYGYMGWVCLTGGYEGHTTLILGNENTSADCLVVLRYLGFVEIANYSVIPMNQLDISW